MENEKNQETNQQPVAKRIKKHEATGDKKPISSLYSLMGLEGKKYTAKSFEEYTQQLDRMDLADLQDHAMEHGLIPIDDRDRMIDKLEKQFIIDTGMEKAAGIDDNGDRLNNEKSEEKALRILRRGR